MLAYVSNPHVIATFGKSDRLLTALNTSTGCTTITAGILQAGTSKALGDDTNTGNTLIFSGGTLQLTLAGAIISPSARGVTLTAGSGGTVDTNNGAMDIQGAISGSGSLTKIGAGTLSVTGANTYSGATNLNGGTVQALSSAKLGDGSATNS